MIIFGQFFAYFSAPRIKSVHPLGDAIFIFITSISLKFGAYLVIHLEQLPLIFGSTSPSIIGLSVTGAPKKVVLLTKKLILFWLHLEFTGFWAAAQIGDEVL